MGRAGGVSRIAKDRCSIPLALPPYPLFIINILPLPPPPRNCPPPRGCGKNHRFHHKVHSLSSVFVILSRVRFVETVFYVFHKVHSLSSKSGFFLRMRSDLKCAFRRHGLLGFINKCIHSQAKWGVCFPYALGFEVCVSSRRFCMFFNKCAHSHALCAILSPVFSHHTPGVNTTNHHML